ncbi:MAG: metallophosphoesterase [Chloroflexia bacterium]|nr:metallophosphoesterase [Chloroflexia bacterium]
MTHLHTRRILALLAVFGLFIGAAMAWWARFVAPRRFEVKHVVVQTPRKHRTLAGLTIAFVTDTHVGPHFLTAALEPIVTRLEEIRPDIVLFGGDYICESPRFMASAAPVLGRMAKTARYGAWGVMGNHDLANIRARVVPPLAEAGIRILANEAVCVETDQGPIWIVGVDDGLIGEVDLDAAFAAVPPDGAAICLWHEGDFAEKSAPYGAFLQLSGHSHGGQVRLPGIGPIAAPKFGKRYPLGRYLVDDMQLYVSSGLGMYRPPVRFNCPPELTVIRLID